MKKRLQGLVTGVVIGAMLTSGMTFAKQLSETAEIFYNNIKIYIDGGEIVPKDANGNIVEPFIMNGSTYLPVRAVSNALGKDVEWDGATQSVFIGKKDQTRPDNYLDRIQYNDYLVADSENTISKINGTVTDYLNTDYKSGLIFKQVSTYSGEIENDNDSAKIIADYPLNSQYSNFKGIAYLPNNINIAGLEKIENANQEDQKIDIFFYADGKLLKKITVTKTMPMEFDLNVKGTNMLTIKTTHHVAQSDCTFIAISDLALYK